MIKGFHEMLVNLIFAVIMDPKESLNNHVSLAFLGSVSEKLKVKCGWSNEAYTKAVNACVKKNKNSIRRSFLNDFYADIDIVHGPYVRLLVAEIADLTIPASVYENGVWESLLQTSHRIFNTSDSDIAIVASELADLHLNEKGMTTFDAYNVNTFRNGV